MADWSSDLTLMFLEAYQQEECLWNPSDIHHKDRKRVDDAWMRLSDMMNKTVKELKYKKEILMVTFRRCLKKKMADDTYKPNWFAYDLMESFLVPIYTNTDTKAWEPSSEGILDQTPEIVEGENVVQASSSFRRPKLRPYRRRPTGDVSDRQMSSAFWQLTNMLKRPPPEDDECDLFAKLLAKKLRELPPDDRKLYMYDIDTLFINRIREKRDSRDPSPLSSTSR